MTMPGQQPVEVWYQNAAFVWIPLMIIGAILAWTMLKSVPIKANIRQQFDIFSNQDTWWMTLLYIMTFGTFSGLSAQFGLLMANLYGIGNAEIVREPAPPPSCSSMATPCRTWSSTSFSGRSWAPARASSSRR